MFNNTVLKYARNTSTNIFEKMKNMLKNVNTLEKGKF